MGAREEGGWGLPTCGTRRRPRILRSGSTASSSHSSLPPVSLLKAPTGHEPREKRQLWTRVQAVLMPVSMMAVLMAVMTMAVPRFLRIATRCHPEMKQRDVISILPRVPEMPPCPCGGLLRPLLGNQRWRRMAQVRGSCVRVPWHHSERQVCLHVCHVDARASARAAACVMRHKLVLACRKVPGWGSAAAMLQFWLCTWRDHSIARVYCPDESSAVVLELVLVAVLVLVLVVLVLVLVLLVAAAAAEAAAPASSVVLVVKILARRPCVYSLPSRDTATGMFVV